MFQKGHKLAPGGKREGAGRPRKGELQALKTAADRARARLESSAHKIMGTYIHLATMGKDPATTRHAVDKLIPEVNGKEQQKQGDTYIQYVFGTEGREIDAGFSQEEQRANLNGGAIRLIGDESGS